MSITNGTGEQLNCSLPFNDNLIGTIRAASGVASVLLGLLATCINVLHKKYRFYLQSLILSFSVAAVIYGASAALSNVNYFIPGKATDTFCKIAGFLNEYSSWTLILAVLAISCNLFAEITGRAEVSRHLRRYWPLLMIFLFPLLFVNWIPFVVDAYGRSPSWPWCTIRTVYSDCTPFVIGRVLKYVLWYAPISILIAIVVILYVASVLTLLYRRRQHRADPTYDPAAAKRNKKFERKTILLVVLLSIMAVPNSAGVVVGIANVQFLPLWIFYALFTPLAPGIVAVLMTVDRQTCQQVSIRMLLKRKSRVRSYHITPVPLDDGVDSSIRINDRGIDHSSREKIGLQSDAEHTTV